MRRNKSLYYNATLYMMRYMAKPTWQKGNPLPKDNLARLRALVEQLGEKETAKLLDVPPVSVTRASAGCGLRRGTIVMIESALAKLVETSSQAA